MTGCPIERRGYVERAEVAEARALAAERRAALTEVDRDAILQVARAQTKATMRLLGVCEQARDRLREDRPQAALALLEEATRA